MRNSNSRDKPSTTTYSQSSQNKLMKTQLPPKTNPKQSLNSTEYKLPPSTPSIKRIESSKSTNNSSKELPKQQINFDIEKNMTQSKIIVAKQSLQLLKKRMNRTGMSRQKIAPTTTTQTSQNIPPPTKTQYAPDSMKKIKSDSNKNIENYEPASYNSKYEQQSYQPQSYKAPSKKTLPPQQQQKPERVLQKKTTVPPQMKNQSYRNEVEQVPIVKKETFEEMLERELRKQQQGQKMGNNSNSFGRNQKIPQQPSEYPEDDGELYECSKGCGRQFNGNVIAKHEKICEKVFQQKRKVFNTAAQRQPEVEGFNKPPPVPNPMNQTRKQPQKPAQTKSKVPKWKLQSAQLRAGLKAISNKPLTKEQQALSNMQKDMLIPCNYCGRKFNETAAKRHIPVCETKAKQMPRASNTTMKKR